MAQDGDETDLNTEKIKEWRSIVTLIVFVLTSEYHVANPCPVAEVRPHRT